MQTSVNRWIPPPPKKHNIISFQIVCLIKMLTTDSTELSTRDIFIQSNYDCIHEVFMNQRTLYFNIKNYVIDG